MRHFFLGLGVGLIGGVMLAPKSGTETREFLGKKTDEGLDYVKTRANDLTTAASSLVDQGKSAVSDLKSTATGMVDKTKNMASDVLHKGAHALRTQPDVEAMSSRLNG